MQHVSDSKRFSDQAVNMVSTDALHTPSFPKKLFSINLLLLCIRTACERERDITTKCSVY